MQDKMNVDRCVICGEIIPEGQQVCSCCIKKFDTPKQNDPLVFICSPYRGKTPDEVNLNTARAERYCRLAYILGYIPFAPHLYFTRFLADNCETERMDGMTMGKVIMLQCSEVWVFGDKITDGMKSEIAYAEAHSIPVKYLK